MCAKPRAVIAEACCNGRSTSRLNAFGTGFTNHVRQIGNRAARNSRTPPKSRTAPAVYPSATSECGGTKNAGEYRQAPPGAAHSPANSLPRTKDQHQADNGDKTANRLQRIGRPERPKIERG